MRTTVAIPDHLYQAAKVFVGQGSFSHFVREAIQYYVERLEHEQMAKAMEEGYRSEATSPSLDPAWSNVDLDAWS